MKDPCSGLKLCLLWLGKDPFKLKGFLWEKEHFH